MDIRRCKSRPATEPDHTYEKCGEIVAEYGIACTRLVVVKNGKVHSHQTTAPSPTAARRPHSWEDR